MNGKCLICRGCRDRVSILLGTSPILKVMLGYLVLFIDEAMRDGIFARENKTIMCMTS